MKGRKRQRPSPEMAGWPSAAEYDQAILNRDQTVYDSDIKQGGLFRDASGPIHLGGGMVCAYRVSNWVVRCLTGSPPADLAERYHAITEHLRMRTETHPEEMDWVVPCTCLEPGIRVAGQDWPLIKVDLVTDGLPLGAFVSEHRDDHDLMNLLAGKWLDLMGRLKLAEIAHGDLDLTNVLVCGEPPEIRLRLIDYDGMYVPALAGRVLTEDGHEHFQPVDRTVRRFNGELDRFSALVIYLSLLALARDPTLWDECQADEGGKLLLGSSDFAEPGISPNIALLERRGTPEVRSCLDALMQSLEGRTMPPPLDLVLATPARASRPAAASRPLQAFSPPIPTGKTLVVIPSAAKSAPGRSSSFFAAGVGPVIWATPAGQPTSSAMLVTRQTRRRRLALIVTWVVTLLVTAGAVAALVAVLVVAQ